MQKAEAVIRSIRFRQDQYDVISEKARDLGIDFSTFVRMSALKAAGVGKEEIARLKALTKSLETVGKE
jgi:uncharacterized protein (DUF1778 family)